MEKVFVILKGDVEATSLVCVSSTLDKARGRAKGIQLCAGEWSEIIECPVDAMPIVGCFLKGERHGGYVNHELEPNQTPRKGGKK